MKPDQDWTEWSARWKQEPRIDITTLLAETRSRSRQMRWRLVAELAATLFATTQILHLLSLVHTAGWKAWTVEVLVLVWAFQLLALGMRRRLWHSGEHHIDALLELALRRARAAVHYTLLNAGLLLIVVLSLIPLAADAWSETAHDPAQRSQVLLIAAVQCAVIGGCAAWTAWTFRRQRARQQAALALLTENRVYRAR